MTASVPSLSSLSAHQRHDRSVRLIFCLIYCLTVKVNVNDILTSLILIREYAFKRSREEKRERQRETHSVYRDNPIKKIRI